MIELSNNVASEWNLLGMLLGISDGELNMIAEHEHGDRQVSHGHAERVAPSNQPSSLLA